MILPIVSAISREVIATVPVEHKEAALALGATRWEMIRMAVLPYSRAGITGAAMLGLGRAIGETIAVTLVIGNSPHDRQAALRPGLHAGRRDRQRVRRGGEPSRCTSPRCSPPGLVLFLLTLAGQRRGTRPSSSAPSAASAPRPPTAGAASSRRGGHMSSLPPVSARRRRTDLVMRGPARRGDRGRAGPARPRHLLRPAARASAPRAGASSRPTPRATSSAIRAGSRAPSWARSRSSRWRPSIAIPVGIGVALYLVEYGKQGSCRARRSVTSSTS